ncbi:hypothetical protein RFI36_04700 [Acinetobacter gerneri]|uniref:SHOCT domain-containing protein n=1 Tax=Acinetobacter gerneri TaxID=202952 RepID=A0AAW8JGA1_9GAMM|nr:hypothetical protein [Acinetobacter gerneri]MDQ9009031.1 hypothetical protein [Acinetobacter gerneri]MDQ9013135.1 hypothetical protein [Acinetobacter gerneri]MDQ9024572.1 hypothetical protein [Acinetobacter gerneri]MDQ9051807.1 hypothetical protein [Acinetobacter gerneri]MDQ9059212.1 hypothetical protein [Acinetobacter gerneri]
MAKYSYTYSGSNAAFVFAGIATLPTGIAVLLEVDQHKALQKNKFAKHLINAGELAVEEVAEVGDSKPASGRGKGAQSGKTDDGKGKDESKGTDLTIDDVRKALTDLEITFAEDETLEQLQEKLAQATE